MEHQKRGASSTDDDDNDDDNDEEGSKEDDGDLTVLQSIPDVSYRSRGGARPGGADGPVGARAEESSARKRAASSPLKGTSLKHNCATVDDDRGSSHVAPISPSSPRSVTLIMDAVEHHPSLEIPKGEDPDLL